MLELPRVGLMALWFKQFPLTASCLSPLPGFKTWPVYVRKLPNIFVTLSVHVYVELKSSAQSNVDCTKKKKKIQPTTPLQISCEFMINLKVILKSIQGTDDT